MQNIISIILSMLMALNSILIFPYNEDEMLETLQSDYVSVATFIEENFELFAKKYNEEAKPKNDWTATGIEKKQEISVILLDGQTRALFLDFSDDDGYAILGNDFIMFDFQTEGESPIKNIDAEQFCYSVICGYLYVKDGEYFSINEENNSTEEFWNNQIQSQETYKGQETNQKGCGKIINPDEYVKDKYGSEWSVSKSKSLEMNGYSQWNLSVYKHNKTNGTYSEGNCWAVSAYTVLQYYADKKYSNMPHSSETTAYRPSISENKIYRKYFDYNGNNISKKINQNNQKINEWELIRTGAYNFTELWAKTRRYVSEKYGKINEGTIWQTENIIKNVSSSYNCKIETDVSTMWGATYTNVMDSVDNGDAFIWSTSNDTYGSHTMAGCGYKLYEKQTKFWFIKKTDYKLFYELKDGHSTSSRYYDVSGHVGFSAIIFLEGK